MPVANCWYIANCWCSTLGLMQQVECLLEWIQALLSRDRAENIFEQTS